MRSRRKAAARSVDIYGASILRGALSNFLNSCLLALIYGYFFYVWVSVRILFHKRALVTMDFSI